MRRAIVLAATVMVATMACRNDDPYTSRLGAGDAVVIEGYSPDGDDTVFVGTEGWSVPNGTRATVASDRAGDDEDQTREVRINIPADALRQSLTDAPAPPGGITVEISRSSLKPVGAD